jgi:hypothetical protein
MNAPSDHLYSAQFASWSPSRKHPPALSPSRIESLSASIRAAFASCSGRGARSGNRAGPRRRIG